MTVSTPGFPAVYTEESRDVPGLVRYEVVPVLASVVGVSSVLYCGAGGIEADVVNPWGMWVVVVAVDAATGETIGRTNECAPVDPDDPEVPSLTLPRAPSIVEVWRSIGVPAPGLYTSPAVEGVTGLETWLWSGGPVERAVSVMLDGWTLTGTARLVGWSYDPGDGAPPIAAAVQGSGEADRAAGYTYGVKGRYELGVTARWEAELMLSGHGVAGHPVDIGTALLTTTRSYQVVEVRAVLIP